MPIYSYQCLKCGKSFEYLSGVSGSSDEIKCPGCSGTEVKKLLSAFSVGKSSRESQPPCGGQCPGGCSLRRK